MRTILFPGSFDPFTKGHADLVKRALKLFDKVVVAIGYNEQKEGWTSVDERKKSIEKIFGQESRVEVTTYTCLTTDLAKQCDACAILRGVRSFKDYEYEMQMADVNRQLTGIETFVLFADPQLASISSSVVRELAHFKHDITDFLP